MHAKLQKGREQKKTAKGNEVKTNKEKQDCIKENSKKRCKVIAERAKTTQACRKLKLMKKQNAQDVREQEKDNAQQAADELAMELAVKKDLILQLKVCSNRLCKPLRNVLFRFNCIGSCME